MRELVGVGAQYVLERLREGPIEVSKLREGVPLYGAAFDIVLSHLMLHGLVRVYNRDGKEYAELTELGKTMSYLPYGHVYPGGHRFGPHSFWHHGW